VHQIWISYCHASVTEPDHSYKEFLFNFILWSKCLRKHETENSNIISFSITESWHVIIPRVHA